MHGQYMNTRQRSKITRRVRTHGVARTVEAGSRARPTSARNCWPPRPNGVQRCCGWPVTRTSTATCCAAARHADPISIWFEFKTRAVAARATTRFSNAPRQPVGILRRTTEPYHADLRRPEIHDEPPHAGVFVIGNNPHRAQMIDEILLAALCRSQEEWQGPSRVPPV